MRIDDRDFSADTVHGSCGCKFEGMTARGIYYDEGGGFVFAAPAPGEPRPAGFDDLDEAKVMIERTTRAGEGNSGS